MRYLSGHVMRYLSGHVMRYLSVVMWCVTCLYSCDALPVCSPVMRYLSAVMWCVTCLQSCDALPVWSCDMLPPADHVMRYLSGHVMRYLSGHVMRYLSGHVMRYLSVCVHVCWWTGVTEVRSEGFCGGAIYKPTWILTAAHCLEKLNVRFLKIVAGTVALGMNCELNHYTCENISQSSEYK